jgi:hypothetical protein
VIILPVCYAKLSIYVGKAGLASVCLSLSLSFVGCLRTHTSFDVLEKQSHTAIRHHTSKRKNQAVSRRKVEPWGLVEDCEKEKKKKRKAQSGPKCHHSVVHHHHPRAPR